ncbi:MAG: hypothetical protein IKX89_06620 [Firmicutes bacterium]|nr:hypothetical protein [Bacillota bacterium]
MHTLIIIIISILIFSALVIIMGLQTKQVVKITGTLAAAVLLIAAFIYGSCYSAICESSSVAVFKTVNAIIEMFLGNDSISSISDAPLMKHVAFQVFVYLAHILAMYITISAVLTAVAMRMLRRIGLFFARRGELDLVYGVNDDTIAFAKKALDSRHDSLVFVGDSKSASLESAVVRQGGILFFEAKYTNDASALIKRIGMRPGKRKLKVFAIDGDSGKNAQFAEKLLKALEERGIAPEQTSLSILAADEAFGTALQASGDRYGYGSVLSMSGKDLIARLLIRSCPPYKVMRFDENGRAENDFYALVIGLGSTGQAVLKALVMNGQFSGSSFKTVIVSRDGDRLSGSFFSEHPGLESAYGISLMECDARSREFYRFLEEDADKINYIVVCTGSEKDDREIFAEIENFLRKGGSETVLARCGSKSVFVSEGAGKTREENIFKSDILLGSSLDAMAMQVNHYYREQYREEGEEGDPEEEWKECPYFDRMSSRATADYIDAFLFAAGKDRETVKKDGLDISKEMRDALGESEHLRWCAFMYAMGYSPMPRDVLEERGRLWKEEEDSGAEHSIRNIARDDVRKLHACITDGDGLDALGQYIKSVTGRDPDYKEIDRHNIDAVPAMLRSGNSK